MIKKSEVWETKDGRTIPIDRLSNTHLTNILYLLRKAAVLGRSTLISAYMMSGGPSGEYAQEAFDLEYDSLLESSWVDYASSHFGNWDSLVKEAKSRGLVLNSFFDEKFGVSQEMNYLLKALTRTDGGGEKDEKSGQ